MVNKAFCSNCGAEYTPGSSYCSLCGDTIASAASFNYTFTHQNHCIACGRKAGIKETYCAACGTDYNDYTIAQGWQSSPTGTGSAPFGTQAGVPASTPFGVPCAAQVGSPFGNTVELPYGTQVGTPYGVPAGVPYGTLPGPTGPVLGVKIDRSVIAPAFLYAAVAVGIGLILSFILDTQLDLLLRDMLYDAFGWRSVDAALGYSSFSLGAIYVWLVTCMGGLHSATYGEYGAWGYANTASVEISLSFGFILLTLIPIVSLLIARVARNAFINSKYAGKETGLADGLFGAGIFAAVNLLISFFPSTFDGIFNRFVEYNAGYDRVSTTTGPILLNLLIFSFIAAFIFAMPGLKAVLEKMRFRGRSIDAPFTVATRYIKLMLLSGVIVVIFAGLTFLLRTFILFGPTNAGVFDESFGFFLLALPNLAIYLMSLLTGGTFSTTSTEQMWGPFGFGDMSVNAFGVQAGEWGSWYYFQESWFGLLMLVAGLWIAVSAMYKVLRYDNNFTANGVLAVIVSAVFIWAVTFVATLGAGFNAIERGYLERSAFSIGSASFVNLLLFGVMMLAAFGVVHLARRSPAFDRFLSRAASPAIACLVTATATVVTALAVASKLFY